MKKLILLTMLTALFLSGCFILDDNNDNLTTSCKISKIVSGDNTAEFVYSNDGLLTGINNTATWNVKIEYDPVQRLNKVEYYNRQSDTLDFYKTVNWIAYNMPDVAFYEYENGTWVVTSKTQYYLTNTDNIEKAEYMEKVDGQWEMTSYTEYTFSNENTVKAETYTLNNGNFEKHYTTTYEYDDKDNALNSLSIRSISEITAYIWFGRNNPVKIETIDNLTGDKLFSATFEYQYNSDNLPVSYIRSDVLASGNTQTYTVSSMEYNCK